MKICVDKENKVIHFFSRKSSRSCENGNSLL